MYRKAEINESIFLNNGNKPIGLWTGQYLKMFHCYSDFNFQKDQVTIISPRTSFGSLNFFSTIECSSPHIATNKPVMNVNIQRGFFSFLVLF